MAPYNLLIDAILGDVKNFIGTSIEVIDSTTNSFTNIPNIVVRLFEDNSYTTHYKIDTPVIYKQDNNLIVFRIPIMGYVGIFS